MSFKSECKYKTITERECECSISSVRTITGNFSLECGNCIKIFESDEPVEINMEIGQSGTLNDCRIMVIVELENDEDLVFEIPKNNILSTGNEIFFITKAARKVTIECKSDSLDVGNCRGFWTLNIILRGSETNPNCECPVENELIGNSFLELQSGENQVIFQSNEPTEMSMNIDLEPNTDQCTLTVIVELVNRSCLKFILPTPISPVSNDIAFYSKNVVKVTLECLTLTSCFVIWDSVIFLRGA
ncbi:hypothetical protein [Vallitalea okinawensis]|uniref:hypothetical protein n=1 Tax=Vallitalea okinawensis TaxID=2078660 RepID=UPI000CFD474D|nr:hypothetical protein [Vallitalea okinawensis]